MNADRPVFIVAAPRSGSTLLFETLMRHQALWSFGDEGHGWIEKYPQLRPLRGGVESNRLTETDLTPELSDLLRQDMLDGITRSDGSRSVPENNQIRIVEKTPKNCLRIPFINSIYPDAQFIYLYRDPKENIASIMEGWIHQRFVTYGDVRTRYGFWCFLRPSGWQQMIEAPLEEIAAFQWRSCHNTMLDDLGKLEPSRWTACSFDQFVNSPRETVKQLQEFCGLPFDEALDAHCAKPLPYSRYTHTAPAEDKWQHHYDAIARVLPGLDATVTRINSVAAKDGFRLEAALPERKVSEENAAPSGRIESNQSKKIGRNEPCPCQSGKKYKHCHGKV